MKTIQNKKILKLNGTVHKTKHGIAVTVYINEGLLKHVLKWFDLTNFYVLNCFKNCKGWVLL